MQCAAKFPYVNVGRKIFHSSAASFGITFAFCKTSSTIAFNNNMHLKETARVRLYSVLMCGKSHTWTPNTFEL